MAQDLMYYFDKKSPYQRHELGEIQTDFNMSLTIDGEKDSMQVQVFGFESNEIKPNTILYHSATNTWWVVKRDIVKRNAHEKGYFYTHNLTISGAIDLLSVRDLTDCGFNDKAYTIDQFIKRLFGLSTFEFSLSIDYGNNVDQNKLVDYVKQFENYSLLSALREFLNGYNCDAKLTFTTTTTSGQTYISGSTLKIIPRTGNVDLDQIDISVFDDIRESKTINKESYGTTVISNANNVISTLTKIYPQVGGMRLNGEGYETTPTNAYLKLPSAIFKINWVKMLHPVRLVYGTRVGDDGQLRDVATLYPWSNAQLDRQFKKIAKDMADSLRLGGSSNPEWRTIYNWLLSHESEILDPVIKASTITLQTGWKFNPINASFIAPDGYSFKHISKGQNQTTPTYTNATLLFGDKEQRDSITYQGRCIYYERGSDIIKGFGWLGEYGDTWSGANAGPITEITTYKDTDLNDSSYDSGTYINHTFNLGYSPNVYFNLDRLNVDAHNGYMLNTGNTYFQVSYIPMNDIKIKYDNQNVDIDNQIYNQNGKLNDSVALSKLISSYGKEIESGNITRFMHYTKFSDIPKVGTIVNNNGEKYVINNISYDFYTNEEKTLNQVSYYIECEFSLSKYVSTKSLMVNPNSNIRDYGIPQKFNVKRRQVYRDYYEFTLGSSIQDSGANQDTPYVSLDKYLYFGSETKDIQYDHTAIMKIDYAEPVDSHESWFYQLNTTAHVLEKSIYETIDFGDNNIIGYDMQNTTSGFDMSRVFNTNWRVVSTPISYVDDNGCFKSITLEFLNKENVQDLYEDAIEDGNYSGAVMLSAHPFIGSELFYGKYSDISSGDTYELDFSGTDQGVSITSSVNIGRYLIKLPMSMTPFTHSDIYEDTITMGTYDSSISGTRESLGQTVSITADVYNAYVDLTNEQVVFEVGNVVSAGTQLDLLKLLGGSYTNFGFTIHYTYKQFDYQGAIDLKDYELQETNYNKDAIEVPVFEYSMQLNDTKSVEIGSDILNGNNELLAIYRIVIKNHDTTSQLNASKYFQELTITGQTISVDDYAYEYDIGSDSGVNMSLESNNTIIRFQFYDSNESVFYGDTNQEQFDYQSSTQGTQIAKSNLIGKDIIIYKSKIKSMNYADSSNQSVDYDNELMFIIHNPQNADFDGDDLLVNVNYYKLK